LTIVKKKESYFSKKKELDVMFWIKNLRHYRKRPCYYEIREINKINQVLFKIEIKLGYSEFII